MIKGVGRKERGQRQKPADSPEEQEETGNGQSMSLFLFVCLLFCLFWFSLTGFLIKGPFAPVYRLHSYIAAIGPGAGQVTEASLMSES